MRHAQYRVITVVAVSLALASRARRSLPAAPAAAPAPAVAEAPSPPSSVETAAPTGSTELTEEDSLREQPSMN